MRSAGELGIDRHVALLVSDEIEVPITTGIMFPRIVLSPDYPEWSPTRRSAILNHELAHIKRLDAFTQALANLAASVYWFHPLVWLMVRAMRAERERACDDHVLAAGTKASDYAHELLDIVSGLREPELAAALAMARKSQLEGRVLAVLNPALPRGSVSRPARVGSGYIDALHCAASFRHAACVAKQYACRQEWQGQAKSGFHSRNRTASARFRHARNTR